MHSWVLTRNLFRYDLEINNLYPRFKILTQVTKIRRQGSKEKLFGGGDGLKYLAHNSSYLNRDFCKKKYLVAKTEITDPINATGVCI